MRWGTKDSEREGGALNERDDELNLTCIKTNRQTHKQTHTYPKQVNMTLPIEETAFNSQIYERIHMQIYPYILVNICN